MTMIDKKNKKVKYIIYIGGISKWKEAIEGHIISKKLPWKIYNLIPDQNQRKGMYEVIENTDTCIKIKVNFDNTQTLINLIDEVQENIIAAVNRGERNIPYFQKITPYLPEHIRVPNNDSLIKATEKTEMRKAFWKYDKKITPKFEIIHDITDIEINRVIKKLGFPVMVKPSGLAQAVLVQSAHYPDELRYVLKTISKKMKTVYKNMKGRGMPGILIEEIINGDMYSIDAFVDDIGNVSFCPFVKYITSNQKGFDDFFSYEQSVPATISKESAHEGKKVATKGIHALGLRNSSAHIEMIRSEGEWKIVEIGPRLGGFRSLMYHLSFGINLDIQDINIHLGKKITLPRKKKGYTSIIKFFAKEEGVITNIMGLKKAKTLASFYSSTQNLKIGDRAKFAKNGGTYVFRITLFNKDKLQLTEDKRRLEKMIHIKTSSMRKK